MGDKPLFYLRETDNALICSQCLNIVNRNKHGDPKLHVALRTSGIGEVIKIKQENLDWDFFVNRIYTARRYITTRYGKRFITRSFRDAGEIWIVRIK